MIPIGFSIPHTKIVTSVPIKTHFMAITQPGGRSFHTEDEYYNEYKTSYFALTRCKGGWDCLRHHEILACGCIPYFMDLLQCPTNTLIFLPKEILLETNAIYERLITHENPFEEAKKLDLENKYILPLLEHTRKYLTNNAMARYFLNKSGCYVDEPCSGCKKVNKILFISGETTEDYMRCTLLHGFKELFKTECHDYPRIPHIYKDYGKSTHLYGHGFTYTNNIDPNYHNSEYNKTIEDDIINHKYNIVIYGSCHRGTPYWDLVNSHYDKKDIILVCGEDSHVCEYYKYGKSGHPLFVRESGPILSNTWIPKNFPPQHVELSHQLSQFETDGCCGMDLTKCDFRNFPGDNFVYKNSFHECNNMHLHH